MKTTHVVCCALFCVACSSSHDSTTIPDAAVAAVPDGSAVFDSGAEIDFSSSAPDAAMVASSHKKVFVVAMENQAGSSVYGSSSAPYLASLMKLGGQASMYGDVLAASAPSEPHYVWMEAGTNVFSDTTFTTDNDVSSSNSTSSTAHLATQLGALPTPKTWRAYEEGLDASGTGACPIASSGQYAPKHDPFVFFQDVSGSPPSKTSPDCAAHHRAFTVAGLQSDLAANDVADYTFITPDLCDDMHGGVCSNGCLGSFTLSACVSAGDTWLQQIAPSILSYLDTHDGVLMVVWDEPETSGVQPFVIVGPHVKASYTSTLAYSHSSYLKSLQEMLGAPVFSNVASANDFADFFDAGFFP